MIAMIASGIRFILNIIVEVIDVFKQLNTVIDTYIVILSDKDIVTKIQKNDW